MTVSPGLDLDVVALDGSIHKAPCGGEGTGRKTTHRHAALCLATAVLITARLIDHRNRWASQ